MTKHPHNFTDLTNQQFGRLTVIRFEGVGKHQKTLWRCKCLCGRETIVCGSNLKKGTTKSCGCLMKELLVARNTRHSMARSDGKHRLYKIWAGMKMRCLNPNEPSYVNYGARGITLCDEWMQFKPFAEWALKNGYRDDLEIDRIDNDRGYCPENCRWVSRQQNQLNKRNNRLLTIQGTTRPLTEWSRISGISIHTILSRIRYGWNYDDLLSPVGQYDVSKRKRDARGRFTS